MQIGPRENGGGSPASVSLMKYVVPISQGHLYTLILLNIPHVSSGSIINFLYPGTPHFHCSLQLLLSLKQVFVTLVMSGSFSRMWPGSPVPGDQLRLPWTGAAQEILNNPTPINGFQII